MKIHEVRNQTVRDFPRCEASSTFSIVEKVNSTRPLKEGFSLNSSLNSKTTRKTTGSKKYEEKLCHDQLKENESRSSLSTTTTTTLSTFTEKISTSSKIETIQEDYKDMELLLGKLSGKEEELTKLREECKLWKLKNEGLQSELASFQYAAEEQAAEYEAREQHNVRKVHQLEAMLAAATRSAQAVEKKFLDVSHNRQNLQKDLLDARKLAYDRARLFQNLEQKLLDKQSELDDSLIKNTAMNETLNTLEETNQTLTKKIDEMETMNQTITNRLGEAQEQAIQAQRTLSRTLGAMDELQCRADQEPKLRQIAVKASTQLIKDLRRQLTVEREFNLRLQQISGCFSPRNSRGIDTCRKPGTTYTDLIRPSDSQDKSTPLYSSSTRRLTSYDHDVLDDFTTSKKLSFLSNDHQVTITEGNQTNKDLIG